MAPRSTWKGTISFGMVSMPVKVFNAVEDGKTRFNQLHDACGGRIKMPKVCEACDGTKPLTDVLAAPITLAKGFDRGDGSFLKITDADLATLPVKSEKAVSIIGFVEPGEIDMVSLDAPYYVTPDKGGARAFALLLGAMQHDNRVAVGKITMRSREALCALFPYGQMLQLATLRWPAEVRPVENYDADLPAVSDAELTAARQLVGAMGGVDWQSQVDEYEQAVTAMLEARIAGIEPEAPAPVAEAAPVVDVLAALTASVAAVKAARDSAAVPV